MPFEPITVKLTPNEVKILKQCCRLMNLEQADVIGVALYELRDLLNTYPMVDYRPDLGGWLLTKKSSKKKELWV